MLAFLKWLYHKIKEADQCMDRFFSFTKGYLSEWLDILLNYNRYQHIKLTIEEQRELNVYWKTHYGKKISNRWHRLYYAQSGIFKVDYMPEYIYSGRIAGFLIDRIKCMSFEDKCLMDLYYKDVIIPETYCYNAANIFYNKERKIIAREDAISIAKEQMNFVIKPTIDSGAGRSVRIVNLENGIDKKSKKTIENIFDEYGSNFILQKIIKQNSVYENIYPLALNTFRIITYELDGKIKCLKPILRMGAFGSRVDNWHFGGLCIGVDINGKLKEYAVNDKGDRYDRHPDTGVVFKDYTVPFVKKVMEKAKDLHESIPYTRMISWDLIVNPQGDIVLVEANLGAGGKIQTTRMNQICNYELFGYEDTARILEEYQYRRKFHL